MIARLLRAVVPSLGRLEQRQSQGVLDDFWYTPTWTRGRGGKVQSPEDALGLSAWWNAIAIIAGTMGSLPLKLYRKDGGRRVAVRDDPRYRLMFRRPNDWQTAFEWREMAQGHLLVRGNHYSLIVRDALGRPAAIVPLHPERVKPEVRGGEIVYRFRSPTGGEELIPMQDMLHLRGLRLERSYGLLGGDGCTGVARLLAAAGAVRLAVRREQGPARRDPAIGSDAEEGAEARTRRAVGPCLFLKRVVGDIFRPPVSRKSTSRFERSL